MKRLIPLLAALFLAVPAFAFDGPDQKRRSVIDDVIRMAQAGVSDEAIIEFVRNTRERFEVTADDMIAMTEAHVSKEVIKAVVDEAADRKDRRGPLYVSPAFYDPWFYPYWYDPFWYHPRLYVGLSFGRPYVRVPPYLGGLRRGHR